MSAAGCKPMDRGLREQWILPFGAAKQRISIYLMVSKVCVIFNFCFMHKICLCILCRL